MDFNEVHQMDVYDEQLYGHLQHFGKDVVAPNVLNPDINPNIIYSQVSTREREREEIDFITLVPKFF